MCVKYTGMEENHLKKGLSPFLETALFLFCRHFSLWLTYVNPFLFEIPEKGWDSLTAFTTKNKKNGLSFLF